MLSRLRCWVFWICQQRSTASITSFCCSDFDATLDLSTQCLRRRRRLSPAELSKCYTRAAFQPFSLSMGSTGICPWPHTVCLVYGRNRPNRCSARAQVPSVCRRLPNLRRHVSECCSQCHRPAFALSSRRRTLARQVLWLGSRQHIYNSYHVLCRA